jgi:polysaccharide chain length determinant protein (PEP-CTERM system associated)
VSLAPQTFSGGKGLRMAIDPQDDPLKGIEDYWAIAKRRRWWIFLPAFLCWTIGWGVGRLVPAGYKSEAVIGIEQQEVPEQYVVPNVNSDLESHIQTMTQQILSRPRLQSTIDRFHLYPPSHGLSSLWEIGDPVERMRKDIKVEVVEVEKPTPGRPNPPTAFKINYTAESPGLAQQVNQELTTLFIDENLKSQQQLSQSTTDFISSELANARVKLDQQEAKVRDFKARHFGDLPSQVQANVQILSGLQGQLQSVQVALDSARQQELYLESIQQQYNSAEQGKNSPDSLVSIDTLNKDLEDMQLRLADARSKYTEDYPDIVSLKNKIAKTEAMKKQMEEANSSRNRKKSDKSPDDLTDSTAATEQSQPGALTPIMQIRSQIKSNQLQIKNFQKREKDLELEISKYQARLNLTPATEQELSDVSRGYEESKANYDSLLKKQNQSQLATSLEQRQQGGQFSILDPPSSPDKPAIPIALMVSLGGLALGIMVGFGVAMFMEFSNVVVRQEKDLVGIVPARVLVGIPHLGLPGEQRYRVLRRWIEIGAVVTMIVLILVGNLYAFYKG